MRKEELVKLGKVIREAIATLPQKDRLVVEYRFYRNMQVKEIAELKMPDLNASNLETAMSMIEGTCRSMGVTVID